MSKPGDTEPVNVDLYDDHLLMLAPVMQLVLAIPPSVLWVVGDTWVRCEDAEYFIDADEKVGYEYVRQLLIESGGQAEQWSEC